MTRPHLPAEGRAVLAHVDDAAHSDLLRWDPDVDATEYSTFIAAADDILEGGDGLRVAPLNRASIVRRLLHIGDRPLPRASVAWMRHLLLCAGFGGYPTYGEWFAVLVEALRTNVDPQPLSGPLAEPLLALCRRAARLYLRAAPYLGRSDARLSRVERIVPCWRRDDVGGDIVWTRSRALLHDYTHLVEGLYWTLRELKIDVAPTVTVDMMSKIGTLRFDARMKETIIQAHYLIEDLNHFLAAQFGQRGSEHQRDLQGANAELPDNETGDAVALQIGALRKELGKYLKLAEDGQEFLIMSRGTVRASLGPLGEVAGQNVRALSRGIFQQQAGSHLAKLRRGTCLAVEGALFRAPEKQVVKAQEETALDRRRQAKRAGMQKLRAERRAEAEREREIEDAKLRAMEGMSPDEVRDARRLLDKSRRKTGTKR